MSFDSTLLPVIKDKDDEREVRKGVLDLLKKVNDTSGSISEGDEFLQRQINGIIESGSNSNGSWIKFADGTMICYGVTAQLTLGDSDYVFPVAFVSPPSFSSSVIPYGNYEPSLSYANTTATWHRRTTVSSNAVAWQAIGKWK